MFSFNFDEEPEGGEEREVGLLLEAREVALTEEANAADLAVEEVRGCRCATEIMPCEPGTSSGKSATGAMRKDATDGAALLPCIGCGLLPLRKHVIPESRVPEMLASSEAAGDRGSKLRETLRASDLVSGGYEGGFKLWECTIDLLQELWHGHLDNTLSIRGTTVLEAGCGAGLPAMLSLRLGCRLAVLHDFNAEVCCGQKDSLSMSLPMKMTFHMNAILLEPPGNSIAHDAGVST